MNLITPDFGLFFWQTVTLLVVLLILGKFAWKPILHAIEEREEYIEAALQAAEVAKEMVARVQADQEVLLKIAQTERTRIIAEALEAKKVIIEEAKVEAEQECKKMTDQTRALLEREQEAALGMLRNRVATLSIQIAETLLQNELKQQHTQEKLVQRLIEETHWG
ncbi:MAG TPA: ATP synthase F0 subunit B [Amoebophilaceae bacterium]|nr:ATP synthase F0 subunit B [Amoebophilaceae bacterium]